MVSELTTQTTVSAVDMSNATEPARLLTATEPARLLTATEPARFLAATEPARFLAVVNMVYVVPLEPLDKARDKLWELDRNDEFEEKVVSHNQRGANVLVRSKQKDNVSQCNQRSQVCTPEMDKAQT